MESSRIFVRGLPPKFTEDDVRKHFAKFPVTDVKFFPHRRIGYVGYKTPEDAAKAVKYFNKTFIKLTKIYAEIARPVSTFSYKPQSFKGRAKAVCRLPTRNFPSHADSRSWRRALRKKMTTIHIAQKTI